MRPALVRAGGPVPGSVALPLPRTDAADLGAAARTLLQVAGAASRTATAGGALAGSVAAVWTGDAAVLAAGEARVVGARTRSIAEAMAECASILARHAESSGLTVAHIRRLQGEWDDELARHRATRRALEAEAATDPSAATQLVRLDAAYDQAKADLSRRYQVVVAEHERAAAHCAALIDAACTRVLPGALHASRGEISRAMLSGLTMPADAQKLAVIQQRAGQVASALLALGPEPSAASVEAFLREHGLALADPDVATAFVEKAGARAVLEAAWRVGAPGGDGGTSADDELLALLGQALVVATSASTDGSAGETPALRAWRNRQQVMARDDLVRAMAQIYSLAGRPGQPSAAQNPWEAPARASGAWLVGQLIVAARQSGFHRRFDQQALRALVAAAAESELAELEHPDGVLVHGTTLDSRGAPFASLFADAASSGDPLHTLLAEVERDPVVAGRLLTQVLSPAGGSRQVSSRGGRLTVAEYLTRRFATYVNSAPGTDLQLQLATQSDLQDLMAVAAGTAEGRGAASAVLRELGRTSELWSQLPGQQALYENNVGGIESDSVQWMLARGASIDAALLQQACSLTERPDLTRAELLWVLSAYARSGEYGGAAEPGANAVRLREGLLDQLRESLRDGGPVSAALGAARVAFVERAFSGGLATQSQQFEAFVRQQARVGLDVASGAGGVARKGAELGSKAAMKALGSWVGNAVTSGISLSSLQEASVLFLTPKYELAQTELNEAREAATRQQMAELLHEAGIVDPGQVEQILDEAVGLAVGAGPNLLTAKQVRERIDAERVQALRAAVDARVDAKGEAFAKKHLPRPGNRPPTQLSAAQKKAKHGERPGLVTFPSGGYTDIRKLDGEMPLPHELATADRLAEAGHRVTFLKATGEGKTPDVEMDDETVEFKKVMGSETTQQLWNTLGRHLSKGSKQAPRIVIDVSDNPHVNAEQAERMLRTKVAHWDEKRPLEWAILITQDGIVKVER